MRFGLIILSITLFGSCVRPKPPGVSIYYNLDSLISMQQQQLTSLDARVDKRSIVGTDTSTTVLGGNSSVWTNELNIFKSANINKSVLEGLYQVENTVDTHSNLTIQTYLPVNKDKVEVKYLKIYYLDDVKDLRRVEAKYLKTNPLYRSEKTMDLIFDKRNNKPHLTKYSLITNQTMKLQDDVSYRMDSEVLY